MLDDALRISFRHETTGTTGDLWRCWKMGRGKKQEERNRRGVRGSARSGLLERPPRAFPPGTRANAIIAASERELRDVRRLSMNIGAGERPYYLTAYYLTNASGNSSFLPLKNKSPG